MNIENCTEIEALIKERKHFKELHREITGTRGLNLDIDKIYIIYILRGEICNAIDKRVLQIEKELTRL